MFSLITQKKTTREERAEADRQYLRNKVDVHLNKLIVSILSQKPEDVLGFIQNWSKDNMVKVENKGVNIEEMAPQEAVVQKQALKGLFGGFAKKPEASGEPPKIGLLSLLNKPKESIVPEE